MAGKMRFSFVDEALKLKSFSSTVFDIIETKEHIISV